MGDFITALILGVVEGITEFLPVSSTGHLIILNQWFGFASEFEKLFDVFIQLGAIIAVVVFFWKRLWPFGKSIESDHTKKTLILWSKVIVGVLPAVVFGFLFDDAIEKYLFTPLVVSIALVVWGIIIIIVDRDRKNTSRNAIVNTERLGYGTALLIGFVQCLAMVPGTSRSAATIIGAMLLGCSRIAAAEFSFFLAIPTMIGASGLTLVKHMPSLGSHDILVLATGFAVAFAVALLVITAFMKFISSHKFAVFGWYRIALGLIVFGFLAMR
jgi:undecaprenyl-diphosphatase